MVPLAVPGGKPVVVVPGETPRSPVMTVLPVLVTVEAPSTPKVAASPKEKLCAWIESEIARLEIRMLKCFMIAGCG